MSPFRRIVVAAAILKVGFWASGWLRGLARSADVDAARLGFEMGGVELLLGSVALALAWALPGRPAERLGIGPSRLSAGAVLALVVGTIGVSAAVDGVLQLSRAIEGSVIVGISRGLAQSVGWSFAVALLGTVIAPAVCEELLCRGLLQRSLARWAGPSIAIVTASLFFGLLHMEWVHGVAAATIGLYLGLAAYWSDSTRPAMLGHGANNLLALLGSTGWLRLSLPPGSAILLGSGLALFGLWWARRAARRPIRA